MIIINAINNNPERQLTPEELATVTFQKHDHVNGKFIFYQGDEPAPVIDLNVLKENVRDKIDEMTEAGIRAGFTFDGVLFSMSDQAQINWTNFPNLPEAIFPLSVYGKNDDPYTLSFADRMNFYLTALAHKNGHLQAGNTRKGQVNACATIEELQTLAATFGITI